jgi:hypothetical protein
MVWYGTVYGMVIFGLRFRSMNKLKSQKATKQKKTGKTKNLEPSPKWKSIGFGNDILEKEK